MEFFKKLAKIICDGVGEPRVGLERTHETILGLSAQSSHDSCERISNLGVVSSSVGCAKEYDAIRVVHDVLVSVAMFSTDQRL